MSGLQGYSFSITPSIHQRFVRAFNVTPITVTVIRGNIFVLINSMAMERDGCFLCEEAKMQLEKLFLALNCTEVGLTFFT